MGKGRKSTPDSLKSLKGTDQKCRMNNDAPSLPAVNTLPQSPSVLNKHGKRVYRTVGQNLLDAGVLNEVNLMMFTALCREYGVYWEAEESMQKLSDRWEEVKDKNGNKRTAPSAMHNISKEALNNARKLAVEFGLTPASISKIVATVKKDKPDLSDILNG